MPFQLLVQSDTIFIVFYSLPKTVPINEESVMSVENEASFTSNGSLPVGLQTPTNTMPCEVCGDPTPGHVHLSEGKFKIPFLYLVYL